MDCRSGRLYASRDDAPENAHPFLREVSDEALTPRARRRKKVGRNEPCPCNSGKKFKQCCKMRIARGDVPA
jgi:preprotein translocase subunit SecA